MRRTVTALIGLALLTAGCTPAAVSGGGSSAKNGQITIGYTAIGAAYSDLYVCQDYGVFRKNGLNVKLTTLNTSSQLLAALSSGSVQIGVGAAGATAPGVLKGIDLRYIANPAPKFYLEMWGKKEIADADALAGHSVAVSSPGSLSDEAVKTMLADKGLEGKVDIKYLKSIPAEVTALEHGAVDAIVTQPPNGTKTRAKGFHKIMDFTQYPAASNVYTVTGKFLETNRSKVAAFVKSEIECLAILHNDRKRTVASIRKHSGTDDEALAQYSYDFFRKVWNRDAEVSPALVRQSFASAAKAQDAKVPANVDKYIDGEFVAKLKSSGFVDSLYGH